MKFTTAAAALALAAVATADPLAINNPTQGTVWKAGGTHFIGWSGNCAFMGNASHSVLVDLMTGPAGALIFVASLEPLDCSSSTNFRHNVTVPSDTKPGDYSIRIQTEPPSFSTAFKIVNGDSAPAPSATGGAPAPSKPSTAPPSAGFSLEPKVLLAAAGSVAVAALQFLF